MRDYLTLEEIRRATGGRILQGNPGDRVQSFSTNTRSLVPGDLFIALKGPHFDGHHFLSEALHKGACGAVISEDIGFDLDQAPFLLRVSDTLFALGEIAGRWRDLHPIPLVAITGSAGKTTTKDWSAFILSQQYNVLSSPGTFNNLVGLPLTLFRLCGDHQMAVVELGMNAEGEIRRLCQICRPDIGAITNIGPAHLEFLGSLEGVTSAKAEMLDFLEGEKTCILNGDDPRLAALLNHTRGRYFTYGLSSGWDLRAGEIMIQDGRLKFQLIFGEEQVPVHLLVRGMHNLYNALASAAIGIVCGLGLKEIKEALEAVRQPSMRLERVSLSQGIMLINDAYNANPLSMRAALDTFFEMKGSARAILVLGDMLELGFQGESLHREMGALLSTYDQVGSLITVGSQSRALAEEARSKGLAAPIFPCDDLQEALMALRQSLKPGDWILLKGSRAMKMERILEGLQ